MPFKVSTTRPTSEIRKLRLEIVGSLSACLLISTRAAIWPKSVWPQKLWSCYHYIQLATGLRAIRESLIHYESSLSGSAQDKIWLYWGRTQSIISQEFCSYSSLCDASSLAPFNLWKSSLQKGSHLHESFPNCLTSLW